MMGSQISYTPRHFYSSRFGKGADDQCAKFGADPSCPRAGVDYVLVLQNRRQLTFRHLADRPLPDQRQYDFMDDSKADTTKSIAGDDAKNFRQLAHSVRNAILQTQA